MPIQVEHLTHTYMPGSPFSAVELNDVSLTIEDGELIGLLGHTGSGKTTLVQHLNGLIKPTSGRVVVDGLDLTQKGVSLLEVRKKVGLVFQYPEYQLFEETVARDIAFGPRNMGLDAEEIDRRVRGAMLQVGLNYDEVAERSPFELSGGQMRRVAIAGVLATKPEYLILDEPIAGLDPLGREAFLQLITELNRGGMTILMVSHNADCLGAYAQRLLVLEDGQLVRDGTPEEIYADLDWMRARRLGVPQSRTAAALLKQGGLDIPQDIASYDALLAAVLRAKGGGRP